jgi:hypothetical protein
MGNFGAKGSPPGYDVRMAIDYLLQFNSSWPLLKIHDTGTFSGTVTHNLGYPPFHMLTRPAAGVGSADGRIEQHASNYSVDSTTLSRNSGSGSPGYFICRLPLDQDFTAAILAGSTSASVPSDDYGFKLTKPGKSINSTDLRDYALHSSTRSPMIQQVKHGAMSNTGGGLGYEYTVTHNLGYTPIAFAFLKPGTNSLGLAEDRYAIVMPPIGVAGRYYEPNASTVYVTADNTMFTETPEVSVVILKEPFNKQTVNVSFP